MVVGGALAAASSFGSWVDVSYSQCAGTCPTTWVFGGGGARWVLVASLLVMVVGATSLAAARAVHLWLTWSSSLSVLGLSVMTLLLAWARAHRFVVAAGAGGAAAARSPGWAAVLCLAAALASVVTATIEGLRQRGTSRSSESDELFGTRSARRRSHRPW